MSSISQKDANLILRKEGRFPTKGSQCNASCVFYFCCANSKDFGTCEKGFQMMNGESKRLLERNLGVDSVKYIENSYGFIERAIQNNNFEGVEVVTRDLSQLRDRTIPQPTQRPSGISYMVQCALGVSTTPRQEHAEPEQEATSEFTRMLEASSKGSTKREQPYTVTRRMTGLLNEIDESLFPDFCNPTACPPDFARHCGANRQSHYGLPCIYKTPRKNR
jgi:hypothetical protein